MLDYHEPNFIERTSKSLRFIVGRLMVMFNSRIDVVTRRVDMVFTMPGPESYRLPASLQSLRQLALICDEVTVNYFPIKQVIEHLSEITLIYKEDLSNFIKGLIL